MKLEKVQEILETGVTSGFISELVNYDLRYFTFKVPLSGANYKIIWWCNVCYLETSCGVYIPFHNLEFKGTWPNSFKMNLQFNYHGNTSTIIPIMKYK